jgi:nitroimidazol reductase NimA-like FMN-containing flavoprotein (pyridoxamine 5'-phosphate oxidase superfamily)
MKEKAVSILDANRLMGLSTVRPDGWPQTTLVSYANDGILIYFVVSRQSQKFQNIAQDDVSRSPSAAIFTTLPRSRHCRLPRAHPK